MILLRALGFGFAFVSAKKEVDFFKKFKKIGKCVFIFRFYFFCNYVFIKIKKKKQGDDIHLIQVAAGGEVAAMEKEDQGQVGCPNDCLNADGAFDDGVVCMSLCSEAASESSHEDIAAAIAAQMQNLDKKYDTYYLFLTNNNCISKR